MSQSLTDMYFLDIGLRNQANSPSRRFSPALMYILSMTSMLATAFADSKGSVSAFRTARTKVWS